MRDHREPGGTQLEKYGRLSGKRCRPVTTWASPHMTSAVHGAGTAPSSQSHESRILKNPVTFARPSEMSTRLEGR